MDFIRKSRNVTEFPAEVQSLFRAYREALPDFDGDRDFMPRLWQRIESQQKVTRSFWRLASGFVTGSLALSMVFAFALWTPPGLKQQPLNPNSTYVEVLADDSVDDTAAPDTSAI